MIPVLPITNSTGFLFVVMAKVHCLSNTCTIRDELVSELWMVSKKLEEIISDDMHNAGCSKTSFNMYCS